MKKKLQGEEQAVFQQFTLNMVHFSTDCGLSDFKIFSSAASKIFNNYGILMASNSKSKNISSVVLLSMLLVSELVQLAVLVNFRLCLYILKISRISFIRFDFERDIDYLLSLGCLLP